MDTFQVSTLYPVICRETLLRGHKPPQAWYDKGKAVQALLQHIRHNLNHHARVPEELADALDITWREDDGTRIGRVEAAQIRVIVDLNRSHFAYVTLLRRTDDGQELPMNCVSATIKGLHRHPIFYGTGVPVSLTGNTGTHERDNRRGRDRRGLDNGGFPMNSLTDVVPHLEDVV
jgi:hypothetical protein